MCLLGRLHVLTDRLDVATAALQAGAPVVQLRIKDASDRHVLDLATALVGHARTAGATLLVNDRVHVAAAVPGVGTHVGVDDLPVEATRRILGPDRVVGATARDPHTARAHQAAGATYLGVGPAYPTTSKGGLPAPLGPAGVAAVADAVQIPVVAIAGVTPGRVGELLDAGAHGVAVLGGIHDAPDPAAATEAYLRAFDRAVL